MIHVTADNNALEIVETDDAYWDLPRAKPEERITRGFDMEKYFGILAGPDEEDDAPGRTDALAASGRMGRSMDPYRDLPRAKPEERNAIRGAFESGRELSMRCLKDVDAPRITSSTIRNGA